MAKKRIDMRKLKEILRLGLREGRSQREIAEALGLGKTTVQEVMAKAMEMQLSWEAVVAMREYQLVERFYPRLPATGKEPPLPDWSEVHRELKKKGVTLALLWEEHREAHPTTLSYGRYCVHYRAWEAMLGIVMRQSHKAGEKLFLDFAGPTVPYLDLESNEVLPAQVFVAVLGASSRTFALAVPDQTVAHWVHANRAALEFFGGVPEILVPDNLKAAVVTPSRYEPKIHPVYLDFAAHYGTAIIPARARKPRDKAKVEVGVQVVERWVLARLRKLTFTSVEDINRAIIPLLAQLNGKVMRHVGKSRDELFEELERPVLRPLPPTPFELVSRKKAKVGLDYHIELGRAYYSVPHRFVGREVEVRYSNRMVEILLEGECLAVHTRLTRPGARHTVAEHMPSHHRAQARWTPERFLRWAKEAGGENTSGLASQIMARYPHPELGFRACRALIRLTERYGKQRVDEACRIALERGERNVPAVERVLKAPQKPQPTSAIGSHENIRGGAYYH